VNSINDGYNYEQYIELSMYYWNKTSGGQASFRDRMALTVNHSMMLRGESLRGARLPHCSSMVFPNEGKSFCSVLVLQFINGKMNQNHRNQHSGAIRHKDVRLCAIGATAMYFFYRFHIEEEFPDFTSNDTWFKTRVLKASFADKTEPLAYTTQNKAIKRGFKAVGITKLTYNSCKSKFCCSYC
jgi:hypothetical protein